MVTPTTASQEKRQVVMAKDVVLAVMLIPGTAVPREEAVSQTRPVVLIAQMAPVRFILSFAYCFVTVGFQTLLAPEALRELEMLLPEMREGNVPSTPRLLVETPSLVIPTAPRLVQSSTRATRMVRSPTTQRVSLDLSLTGWLVSNNYFRRLRHRRRCHCWRVVLR